MISQEQIIKMANQYQTTEVNVLREYFQHLFLSYFYQQPLTGDVYFKGGSALRLVYSSPRFSEDLDFNTLEGDMKKIEDSVLDTLEEVEHEGIPVAVEESKQTTGGYLGIFKFTLNKEVVTVQVEISFRKQQSSGELKTIVNDFIPPYTLIVLQKEQLVNEKIQALLARGKPRDFYDLYFMLRANLISTEKRKILTDASKLLKASEINFERELKQFLPKSHWAIIRNFKTSLETEIKRFI